ncbi:MAG: efflux RND transporter periplasmic adaptor subunit [Candidatus Aminicenantales bacterium]
MNKPSRWIIWAALPLLFAASGCRGKSTAEAALPREEHAPEAAAEASVTLSPEAVTAADIRTAPAAIRALSRRITAPGELEYNPRRLAHLTARTSGRIERVFAFAGDRVRAGQVLAEIYSPDYMAIQAEYLQAADRAARYAGDPSEAGMARAILESARERLLLVGAAAAEVDALRSSPVPRPLLPVRAAWSGTVIEASVLPGDHVELGTNLFRLADLSTLWAGLRIQERDLPAIKSGAEVEIRTQAYPGDVFRGRLLLVGDALDTETRTIISRAEVPNPAGRLKTGMYVEAVFEGSGERKALVVPESSIQDDEGRSVVFVQTGERTFARRAVVAGEQTSGFVEILKGLTEGDTVVVSGGFLLESETRKDSLED